MPKPKRSRADAFGSLLGVVEDPGAGADSVPLARIQMRGRQPRRHFDEASLASLAESVREQGVLQPVLLRRVGERYELIAGERRVRAARLAGLQEVPAVVREVSDEEADLLAALENLQREDLNPLDEVEATLTIVARELGVGVEDVVPLLHAQRRAPQPERVEQLERVFRHLGRGSWRSFASNRVGVLRFPAELLDLMRQGRLEYTRAAALARVKDPVLRAELIQRTMEQNLGVRDITAAAKPTQVTQSQYERVRTLLDERRVAQLDGQGRTRVQELMGELESLLGGLSTRRRKRS